MPASRPPTTSDGGPARGFGIDPGDPRDGSSIIVGELKFRAKYSDRRCWDCTKVALVCLLNLLGLAVSHRLELME